MPGTAPLAFVKCSRVFFEAPRLVFSGILEAALRVSGTFGLRNTLLGTRAFGFDMIFRQIRAETIVNRTVAGESTSEKRIFVEAATCGFTLAARTHRCGGLVYQRVVVWHTFHSRALMDEGAGGLILLFGICEPDSVVFIESTKTVLERIGSWVDAWQRIKER